MRFLALAFAVVLMAYVTTAQGQSEGRDSRAGSVHIHKHRPLKLSARNEFAGTIIHIAEGQAMAEVSVKVGELEMVAAVTKASVEQLGLKVNDPVTVVVKSTDVMIGK